MIELLVVIAIIALLIGILLPALGAARTAARTLVCSATQRDIAQFQQFYMTDNKDYYSAPGTSVRNYAEFFDFGGTIALNRNATAQALAGENTTALTPTSTRDWLSPIAGEGANLTPRRAEKTSQLFNDLACAATANLFNDTIFNPNSAPDGEDFVEIVESGRGFRAISYLMPSSISSFGGSGNWVSQNAAQANRVAPNGMRDQVSGANTSPSFIPRLDRVARVTSNKIVFADGTRYFSSTMGLDFDPNPTPGSFGSFVDNNPITEGSTAYGRNPFSSGAVRVPDNQLASFRHKAGINAAYFDGHVGRLSQTEAYTDPNPWYPSGSIWTGENATPESQDFMNGIRGGRDQLLIN